MRVRTTAPARRLQPLNTPRRVNVAVHADGHPLAVTLSRRKFAVDAVHETWRIDDEWWRPKPISRVYWRLSLEDGRVIDVYRDLSSNSWFRQAYG